MGMISVYDLSTYMMMLVMFTHLWWKNPIIIAITSCSISEISVSINLIMPHIFSPINWNK